MPEGYATISEVCAEFGVTQRTLRYYEYIELLAPRRDGTRRLYSS
ncbi:MAG: MerR family DNA-binding transcriptional regulator, partial [Pseudomonadota bacterium]